MNIYAEIFKAFNEANIEYLIVGGVAVNLYGYNRFTGDIDILLALDKNNLEKMDILMQKMGYIPRLPVEIQELYDTKKLKQWIKEKGLKAYTFINNQKPQLDIDILVEESLVFKKQYTKRTKIEVWDIQLPVISLENLINMKKKANRQKDLEDIKALLELKNL